MQRKRDFFYILIIAIQSIVLFLLYFPASEPVASDSSFERRLKISAAENPDVGYIHYSTADLNDALSESLTYRNLENVSIEIDGSTIPLADAIKADLITPAEIFAYARIDAANAICQETFDSQHGLSSFVYAYPEFDLRLVYDIYETPDGIKHLINTISLYSPGTANEGYQSYYEKGTDKPLQIDREDWGLSCELVNVTPTGITLNCTQSGGQQIGQLYTQSYFIDTIGQESSEPDFQIVSIEIQEAIQMEGSTTLHLDWSEACGILSQCAQ